LIKAAALSNAFLNLELQTLNHSNAFQLGNLMTCETVHDLDVDIK
jgi:hypothetical protein